MSGFVDATSAALHRSQVWSSQLKEVLMDDLMATSFVRWLTDFPDGDTFNVPSIGQAVVRNYFENQPVQYDAFDTGNFQFTISEYLSSATYITRKQLQDIYYMSELTASFTPKQARAIMEHVEGKVFGLQSQQTPSSLNTINGAPHRRVASGTNQVMTIADFARMGYALKKANVPMENLVAVVDPSFEFTLSTLTNIVNVSNNPKWEGVIETGFTKGMKFIKNVFGFDVWTSNYLTSGISETINSVSVTNGVANLFFSATPDMLPFVGAWRQHPIVDSEFNKDLQREEHITTARYGVKLFRPENLGVILSDAVQAVA